MESLIITKMTRNIRKDKMENKIDNNEPQISIKIFTLTVVLSFLILFLLPSASSMSIKNVVTSPTEIAPGQVAKITIEIENTLSEDVTNVNVALDLSGVVPIAPYQGSSEESVDEIG